MTIMVFFCCRVRCWRAFVGAVGRCLTDPGSGRCRHTGVGCQELRSLWTCLSGPEHSHSSRPEVALAVLVPTLSVGATSVGPWGGPLFFSNESDCRPPLHQKQNTRAMDLVDAAVAGCPFLKNLQARGADARAFALDPSRSHGCCPGAAMAAASAESVPQKLAATFTHFHVGDSAPVPLHRTELQHDAANEIDTSNNGSGSKRGCPLAHAPFATMSLGFGGGMVGGRRIQGDFMH